MKRLILAVVLTCYALGNSAQPKEEEVLKRSLLGQKFPAFEVQKWLGEKPDTKGKYVLVDFWNILAYPVIHRTVPHQNQLAEKFKDKLCIIGLSSEDPYIVSLMVDPVIEYYNGIIDYRIEEELFDIQAWPATYLINPEGIVIWEGYVLKEGQGNRNTFNLTEKKLTELLTKQERK
ncbi:MAG: redoxin domain-containing protein [Odoribacter sp.]|nr:redoxin domain-containing protein [Odoribacter sp.]